MCRPIPGTRRNKNRISAVTSDQNANPRFPLRIKPLRSAARTRSFISFVQRIPGIYRTRTVMALFECNNRYALFTRKKLSGACGGQVLRGFALFERSRFSHPPLGTKISIGGKMCAGKQNQPRQECPEHQTDRD